MTASTASATPRHDLWRAQAATGAGRPALHALTWLVWAAAAAASVQLAPNPLYVVVVVAVSAVVVQVHHLPGHPARAFRLLVGLGSTFVLVRVLLTVLTTHGNGDVMVTLPERTMPRLLGGFAVGGPVEWSVMWQAAAQGLVVVGVMAAFGAFNAVASHYELVQRAPRALHEPGLILTVALAFVPSTIAAAAAVREADVARTGGRAVRRGRLVRQAVPVLETGLERAVHLAESMDGRGFGRARATTSEQVAAWLALGSLLGLAGALVALVGRAGTAAALSGVLCLGCLAGAVVLSSRGARRGDRYRPRRLTRNDAVIMVVGAAVPLGLVLLDLSGEDSLRWAATVPLRFPVFHLLPALCLALLVAPALVPPAPDAEP